MPIARINTKLVYFCHVPKCGGSAVTRYLKSRFGPVAFEDTAYLGVKDPWNRTSPQHVSADDLSRLFPGGFFDEAFAVVRHPVARMLSEFHYLRDNGMLASEYNGFSDWLNRVSMSYAKCRFTFDNHLRPMCEIVPSSTTVFKLEDGLDQVVSHLDTLAGNNDGPRFIEPWNQKRQVTESVVATERDIALIERLYSRDFDRFNYARSELVV